MTEADQMFPGQIAALVVVDQHLIDRCLAQIPVDHAGAPASNPCHGIVATAVGINPDDARMRPSTRLARSTSM